MGSVWTIRRSATDAKLAGLCGGVARHWGVDPVLVRVGCALLALSGGIGLVLYLAGWLLVPVEGRQTSTLDDLLGTRTVKWPREAWVAIVVVACIISFALFSSLLPIGLGPALILAVIWYFGYYKNRSRGDAPPPPAGGPLPPSQPAEPFGSPGPVTPFTEAAEVWRRRMEENLRRPSTASEPTAAPPVRASVGMPTPTSEQAWPAMPRASVTDGEIGDATSGEIDPESADGLTREEDPERAAFLAEPDPVGLYVEPNEPMAAPTRRLTVAQSIAARRLRLTGLVVLGLTLAALGVADAVGIAVPLTAYLGAALLVVGLTLVAATWLGRARGILPVGLLLAVALLSVSVVNPHGEARVWNQQLSYSTAAQLPADGDSLDLGAMTVDLSHLALTRSQSYTAHVGTGKLEVVAPRRSNVQLRYRVDQGVVFVNESQLAQGSELADVRPVGAARAGQPTLTLNLSVDVGELRVRR